MVVGGDIRLARMLPHLIRMDHIGDTPVRIGVPDQQGKGLKRCIFIGFFFQKRIRWSQSGSRPEPLCGNCFCLRRHFQIGVRTGPHRVFNLFAFTRGEQILVLLQNTSQTIHSSARVNGVIGCIFMVRRPGQKNNDFPFWSPFCHAQDHPFGFFKIKGIPCQTKKHKIYQG